MPEIESIESITIIAKRWFSKSCGNTYHSCRVIVNETELPPVRFAYGYGEGYLQTAHDMLMTAGYFPKTGKMLPSGADADYSLFHHWAMDNRSKLHVNCHDVSRRRDL